MALMLGIPELSGPPTGLSERELLMFATTVAPVSTAPLLITTLGAVGVCLFMLLLLLLLLWKCVVAVDISAAEAEAGRDKPPPLPLPYLPLALLLVFSVYPWHMKGLGSGLLLVRGVLNVTRLL